MLRLVLLLSCLTTTSLYSQQWRYIDNRLGRNVPQALIETYDKGLLFAVNEPDIYKNFYLYKLNVNGEILWQREYVYNGYLLNVNSMIKVKNDGFLVGGYALNVDSLYGTNPFLLKLNECYEVDWFKTYKEPISEDNEISKLIEYNGNYLVIFSYLIPNHKTLIIMNKEGKILKKRTIEADYLKPIIGKNGLISFVGFGYPEGLLHNPNIGLNKSIYAVLDSNLNIKKFEYYKYKDTFFLSTSTDISYLDSSEANFITISNNRNPNSKNPDVAGGLMITKNHKDNWYKTIGDTNVSNGGSKIVKINNNKYAILGGVAPNNDWLNYGLHYIIDSNANVLYKIFENKNNIYTSDPHDMIKTYDGNLITIGNFGANDNSAKTYCYKYNQDLTPFIKQNIMLNYDTLCTKGVKTAAVQLPQPTIIKMIKDSFLSIKNIITQGIQKINLFPNPCVKNTFIEINNQNVTHLNIAYYDALGKYIKTEKVYKQNNKFELNTSELALGTYVLSISNSEFNFNAYSIIVKQ